MKRISITIALLALMALPVFAQRAKRIVNNVGQHIITLTNIDSSGVKTGVVARASRTQLITASITDAKMYDVMIGSIYAPDFVTDGSAAGGVGNIDTTIITIRAEYPFHTVVLYTDTLIPPDSAYFKLGWDELRSGALRYALDSGGVDTLALLWVPDTVLTEWASFSNIYYTAYSSDSSGTNPADTNDSGDRVLTQTLQHFFRLFEWATGDLGR